MYDLCQTKPAAEAKINGIGEYTSIHGTVSFYAVYEGTIVAAEIYGIPADLEEQSGGFLGFHIHEGAPCSGTKEDPLSNTKAHYNPKNAEHPRHAGDLPPLLCSHGNAWMSFYTGRFYPEDVIFRTAVIHQMPDDFRSQPSGDSGMKIACGIIRLWEPLPWK